MISSLYAPVIVVILLSSGYNAPDMVFHGSHIFIYYPFRTLWRGKDTFMVWN